MGPLLLALLLSFREVASASSSRFPLPPSSYGLVPSDCTHGAYSAAVAKAINGSSAAAGSALEPNEAAKHVREYCGSANGVCPAPAHVDVQFTCADHSVHSFASDFTSVLKKRSGLMWNIFFVICSLLFGAVRNTRERTAHCSTPAALLKRLPALPVAMRMPHS